MAGQLSHARIGSWCVDAFKGNKYKRAAGKTRCKRIYNQICGVKYTKFYYSLSTLGYLFIVSLMHMCMYI